MGPQNLLKQSEWLMAHWCNSPEWLELILSRFFVCYLSCFRDILNVLKYYDWIKSLSDRLQASEFCLLANKGTTLSRFISEMLVKFYTILA